MNKKLTIHCDGAASGNPGPAAAAIVVVDGPTRVTKVRSYEKLTNNQAEYHGFIAALKYVVHEKCDALIHCDSKLVMGQVLSNWKCQVAHLKPLCVQAKSLLESAAALGLKVEVQYVRSADNLADPIAKGGVEK